MRTKHWWKVLFAHSVGLHIVNSCPLQLKKKTFLFWGVAFSDTKWTIRKQLLALLSIENVDIYLHIGEKKSNIWLPTFYISCSLSEVKNHTDLVPQSLIQPTGPRSAQPCPDPQLTQARGRHMSIEHWSRVRSGLCTVGHVPLDATKNNGITEKKTSPLGKGPCPYSNKTSCLSEKSHLNTERSYITRLRFTACQSEISTDEQCSHLIGVFTQV